MTTRALAELRNVSVVTAHNIMTGLCETGFIKLQGKKYYLSYSELAENYAFDKTLVDENDYVYIDTKEGEGEGAASYGRFENYSVYFIDISTNTLYYFHSNI